MKYLLLFFGLLIFENAISQTHFDEINNLKQSLKFPATTQSQNVSFRNITPADGLPSTGMFSITQDALGFIWIGTWDYTYRYDGYTFKKIRGTDGGRFVHGDNKGGVWLTFPRFVGYYNPYLDSIRKYNIPNIERFVDLKTDAVDNVWVTSKDGIVKFDTTSQLFAKESGQRSGVTRRLNAWGNGELLFHFQNNDSSWLLGRRSMKGIYTYEKLPIDFNSPDKGTSFGIRGAFGSHPIDSTGILITNQYGWAYKKWIETDWTFHKALNNILTVKPDDIKLDGQGNMWFTQINALIKVNIISGKTTVYAHDPTNPKSILPMNSNRALLFDRQGVLWIAHFGYGISRLNLFDSDFGLLKDSANIPVLDVISALELKDGSYWIGSRNQKNLSIGLIHYDAKGNVVKRYGSKSQDSPPGRTISNELSNAFAHSLAVTADGSIWVGTGSQGNRQGGLNRIRPGSDQITRFKHDPNDKSSIPFDYITRLLVDGSDRVWANYLDQGVFTIDPTTEKITNEFNFQSKDTARNTVYYLEMVSASGDIIIRENEYNHYIIDHKTLQARPFAQGITSNGLMLFNHLDDAGKIWFSSVKGFGYLNTSFTAVERLFEFDKLKLPFDEQSGSFYSDKRGNIWLGTHNGLVQFDPNTETIKHFGFERGLQGNLFNEDNYKGPSGKLYYTGTGGVNIFDPETINTNPYPPQMVFTGLKLNGKSIAFANLAAIQKPISVADKITVGPEIDVISIDFSAIHSASNKDKYYQYKLAGFDTDWRDGGTIGNATYTNLPPGAYTLYIKGSNLDNVWSDGNKSISISILPPWWRTWWAYTLYGILFLFLSWQLYKYQQSKIIRKERERTQARELEQAKEIEKAYTELKSTQAQLIQSEKMASLGELTAGIAHEIQNPLNFVNNFSEVNTELIDELQLELKAGKIDDAVALSNDIKENEQKINHHGKRAESIVKGMLEHSRKSTGAKEPTEINKLCDEFVRLSYHGMKAKDKEFNCDYKLDLDPHMPLVNVVSQDIGRVMLNIVNNAFQACSEKSESMKLESQEDYKPLVTLKTQSVIDDKNFASSRLPTGEAGLCEIIIADNGPGIPPHIKDKIFQPFFTTKPTGQGTGLGLSLAYDIIKAHGGTITVKSNDEAEKSAPTKGEGSTFTIIIPIT